MAKVTINQNPKTTDTIVLQFLTPDADGCFFANPYMVNSVYVYYVERSYSSAQFGEYNAPVVPDLLLQNLQAAQATYCATPSQANLLALQNLQMQVANAATNTFYYSDASPALVIGDDPNYPAWLSTDIPHAFITNVPTSAQGAAQYGVFQYEWMPNGDIRPGDFFMCWTWTPNPDGNTLSQTVSFTVQGDPNACMTIPTHLTPDAKYPDLLERYLPEMYKSYLSQNDITPETLRSLQDAIATGFKGIEDQANQLIDLFDANALQESLLVYLGNLFNLKFKSNDPTLWRRQIKEAVPLFKQKGTKSGLRKAFSQSGMVLNKITRLWQIVSPYTWTESFLVDTTLTWVLTMNPITPIDSNNFEVAIRRQGQPDYVVVTGNSVYLESSECGLFTNITWSGANPPLPGDIIRVLYAYRSVASQTNEDYIQALPLADLRDEFAQVYPKKNWVVHVIEEDDPMFDVLIPVRFPFHELVVFGKVRTEFPYSENIYNMEEYNASTRDSINPCDIDKNFVDPCGSCLSSKFIIDVGIQELTDDRIDEMYEVLQENVPFHAFVHSVNISGEIVEFMMSPIEHIQSLIMIYGEDYILAGNANPIFTRVIEEGLTTWRVNRDQPATMIVEATDVGIAYNEYIAFVAPLNDLDHIGLMPLSHVLEVLSPSPNAGSYQITPTGGSLGTITAVAEPLNKSMFTYNLSNITYSTLEHATSATIVQDNMNVIYDDTVDFTALGVQGLWDVQNVPGCMNGWQVISSSITYYVYTVLPDGGLVIDQTSLTLSTYSTNVEYTLIDPLGNVMASSFGLLQVTNIGSVTINDPQVTDITQFAMIGDWVNYLGQDYPVTGTVDNSIQIGSQVIPYTSGGVGGVAITIKRRLINNALGYFDYSGLKLQTNVNYEVELGILNGSNPPPGDPTDNSLWKENFLVAMPISPQYFGSEAVLDDPTGNMYFKIAAIDGTDVTLDGLPQNWGTLATGGTVVNFEIDHFIKDPLSIDFLTLDQIDRSGKDPVVADIFTDTGESISVLSLRPSVGNNVQEMVHTEEGVSFEIEWRNSEMTQGDEVI